MMRTKVVTPAVGHVLTIETCRQQLELVAIDGNSDGESHPDDDLILAMLDAAVEHAEAFTGLSIAIRTYEGALDELPRLVAGDPTTSSIIDLPHPPLIELISFTTGDGSDVVDVDADTYIVDEYGDSTRLRPVTSWLAVANSPNTVRIQYKAGYSSEGVGDTDATELPGAIRAAVLLMMAHLYESREDAVEKAMSTIPNGFEALLRPRRVLTGLA